MKKFFVLLIAVLLVIGGIFMLGWSFGDNETGLPAGLTCLYLIVQGAYYYHFFKTDASYLPIFRIRF